MTFKPSTYQQAIFDFITDGRGNGIVNAVAGSGKTTSLVQAAKLLKTRSSLFVAFNKHIADELQERLAGTGMTAKTVHSLGYGCIARHLNQRLQVEDSKYYKICKTLAERGVPRDERGQFIRVLKRLCELARVTLTPLESLPLWDLAARYNIDDVDDRVIQAVPEAIAKGDTLAESAIIDFTDMIYLPYRWNLQPPRFDWVFVDELQDLNAAQRELVLKCPGPGGRILGVGDVNQAIYGFSGADYRSFERFRELTNAQDLPLSICYRCPTSVLDLARAIVPHIEAAPDAPAGTVQHMSIERFMDNVREGDLVLCRVNAPLVSQCIQLIQRQVPAKVRGRDIGKDLTGILRTVEKAKDPWFEFQQLPGYLDEYERQQVHNLSQRDGTESQIESLRDKVLCLQVCTDNMGATSLNDLCDRIEALFSDERASVWFSSVHRAKGLEGDRIFLLAPEKMPLVWEKQTPDQYQQEMNLRYVALTRAKDTLIFLDGDDAEPDKGQEPTSACPRCKEPGWNGDLCPSCVNKLIEEGPVSEPTAHYCVSCKRALVTQPDALCAGCTLDTIEQEPVRVTPVAEQEELPEARPAEVEAPVEPSVVGTAAYFEEQRREAVEWASRILAQDEFYVLDLETTGLGPEAQICQLGIVDQDGSTVVGTRVKPTIAITPGAAAVTGIDDETVKDAPGFADVYESLAALQGKTIIIYNRSFDEPRLRYVCEFHELPPIEANYHCAMLEYARYHGAWSSYHQSFKWQKLVNACRQLGIVPDEDAHDAVADCKMTLAVMRAMAGIQVEVEPELEQVSLPI